VQGYVGLYVLVLVRYGVCMAILRFGDVVWAGLSEALHIPR
jgi:hypothetical protein